MFWYLPWNRFVPTILRVLFARWLIVLLRSFDATYLYQYTFILLYNLIFTSLPVIVLGGEFAPHGNVDWVVDLAAQRSTRTSMQKRPSPSHNFTFEVSVGLSTRGRSFGSTWLTASTNRWSFTSSPI